jgi:hypothetical protein
MAARKGHVKAGGRQAGTPNRVTKNVREWIFGIVYNNIGTLDADLKALEPKERWGVIMGLLPYVAAKRVDSDRRITLCDFPSHLTGIEDDEEDNDAIDIDLLNKYK